MMWVVPEASDTHGYHTLTTREYSRNSTRTRMTELRSQVRYHLHGSRQRIRPGDSFEVIVRQTCSDRLIVVFGGRPEDEPDR